jgi:hypothetical protein
MSGCPLSALVFGVYGQGKLFMENYILVINSLRLGYISFTSHVSSVGVYGLDGQIGTVLSHGLQGP